TIQDLLTHVSGLASGGQASSHELGNLIDIVGSRTLADMMPKFAAAPLDFQPGTRWRYSGLAGFDTLGRVVEIASGMSFDQFLRTQLFEPLGINHTFFNVPATLQPRIATNYNHTDKGLERPANPIVIGSPAYFSG